MLTAVDTNVLADVFSANPRFGRASEDALRRSASSGRLVACETVFAECAAAFNDGGRAADALQTVRVEFSPLDEASALAAGELWAAYRKTEGPRTRVVADFLVGAHALLQADRLLTRDRGFYRGYFEGLEVLDPSA
jgi:predicted nucleic acid-binding protein